MTHNFYLIKETFFSLCFKVKEVMKRRTNNDITRGEFLQEIFFYLRLVLLAQGDLLAVDGGQEAPHATKVGVLKDAFNGVVLGFMLLQSG